MRLRVFLPLVLLLAGCQSERSVFRFAPGATTYARRPASPSPSLPAAVSVAPGAAPTAPSALTTATAVAAARPTPGAQRPRSRPVSPEGPERVAPRHPRGATAGARVQFPEFLGRHPAERAFLITGGGSTVLGLLANYLAIGAGSSTRVFLLDSGHFLLVLGSLLLLAWFVLLLLRVVQEK